MKKGRRGFEVYPNGGPMLQCRPLKGRRANPVVAGGPAPPTGKREDSRECAET
ncbi:MAG: hypothetical protein KJ057_02155 [Phycisphaerae bacterium]|nr:hypothetical protein [Planctomycetia bacterium]MCK6465122.1 hypothetical protein [Phycisphaerae bacterium]MCL4717253.1 hypothetical protein [Phycisphaerae bacterium]NUQ07940.1 hypothetical protein [Phycisphaerae bacterium]